MFSFNMSKKLVLEICVDNLECACIATNSGADRIELCSDLVLEGLSPSTELFLSVKEKINIPVFIMIRSRPGNFVYDKTEMDDMVQSVLSFRNLGVDGFVFGALQSDNEIDEEACAKIIKSAEGLPVTFHRAFDLLSNKEQSLETLTRLGFKRILTSGVHKGTAFEGINILKRLIQQADNQIIIMPGGGITDYNISCIMKDTSAVEYHSSGRQMFPTNLNETHVILPKSTKVNGMAVRNMKKILTGSLKCN